MARTLAAGCTGADVKELQLKLNNRMPPWSAQLNPDGVFGAKTEAAVKEYQALHNIEMAGVVGPATRGALATRVLLMQGDL
jgi:peptidoglycan hydrolase-like protein with peptidoglycan-binding domain